MKNQSFGLKILLQLGILLAAPVLADEQTHWAKQAQNPFADIIKLPIVQQFDFGFGHKDALNYTASFRPSMAAEISSGWNLVNRMDIPFKYQPGRTAGEKDSFGLGDITYESFYTPAGRRNANLGAGFALQIPSATDPQIGSRKWSAGLAAAAHTEIGFLTAGLRANHLWSFAGKDDRPDVNRTEIEYWLYANLGSGWWIGTSPLSTADWEAGPDDRWTVPAGGGIGRIFGSRIPVNLSLEAYAYPEAPDGRADWSCMLGLEFLLPENSLYKR